MIVESYPSIPSGEFTSSINDPFSYPGEPPEGSYVTDGENVILLPGYASFDQMAGEVNAWLRRQGVAELSERYPILAYGANRNPSSLFRRFDEAAHDDNRLAVVPVIAAKRSGSEVAWSHDIGTWGRQFADLVSSEDVEETEISVHVTMLTHDQLQLMHASESEYDIVEQGTVMLEGGIEIPCFYYSVSSGVVYGRNKLPVAVRNIAAKNRIAQALTAEQSLQSILDSANEVNYPEIGNRWNGARECNKEYLVMSDEQQEQFKIHFRNFMEDNNFMYHHFRPDDARVYPWAFNVLPALGQLLRADDYLQREGVQGRMFLNDLVISRGKRESVEAVLRRDS